MSLPLFMIVVVVVGCSIVDVLHVDQFQLKMDEFPETTVRERERNKKNKKHILRFAHTLTDAFIHLA